MRVLGNIIWLVFGGLLMAIGYLIAALIMFILIITIPFGLQAMKMASFTLWPFGRTLVKRETAGAPSLIGNILWLILCGWWLAIGHLITGVAQCLTVIGIPLGLASFKLIPVSLWPFGREIVPVDELQPHERDGAVAVLPASTPAREKDPTA
ncbi:MAG: YccF domain-containing protein [Solirubrobacterales bacterium]